MTKSNREKAAQKFGVCVLAGLPNAGKSVLFNNLIQSKVSIVSAKAGTTRNAIQGVITFDQHQILFIDSPGLERALGKGFLGKVMRSEATNSLMSANVVCYLIDSSKGIQEEDIFNLKQIFKFSECPILPVFSKIDSLKKDQIDANIGRSSDILQEFKQQMGESASRLEHPIALSAKRPEELKSFRGRLQDYLLVSEHAYPEDTITTHSTRFLAAEIVREKLFRLTGKEIPYQCAVTIDQFEEEPKITKIHATIVVSKESHKSIIIGKQGAMIKRIGTEARLALEELLEMPVFIKLFVRVQKNWQADASQTEKLVGLEDQKTPLF